MSENKEAVDAAAHILTGLCNATCCHKTGGKTELPNCECRQTARLVIAAIRPHILEEAAKCLEGIADAMEEKAEAIRAQSEPFDPATSDERDAAVTAFEFRRAAAAIRAAKEGE